MSTPSASTSLRALRGVPPSRTPESLSHSPILALVSAVLEKAGENIFRPVCEDSFGIVARLWPAAAAPPAARRPAAAARRPCATPPSRAGAFLNEVMDGRLLGRFCLVYAAFFVFGRGLDLNSRLHDVWPSLLLAVLTYRRPILEPTFCVGFSASASLLYIMDWQVWYQQWPLPTVCGALVGSLVDSLFQYRQ